MNADSDQHLFHLYRELGDLQSARQRPALAADAYALALYYARRMGDVELAASCQQQVIAHHPQHVAAQTQSAPLFFAQLLMRYPADEVQKTVAEMRQASATPAVTVPFEVPTTQLSMPITGTGTVAATAPPAPPTVELSEQPTLPSFQLDELSTAKTESPVLPFPFRPQPPEPEQFEQHHVFDLGSGEMGSRAQSLRLTEEFLHPHTQSAESSEPDSSEIGLAIHFAAVCAVVVGLISIGYFTVQLVPVLTKERVQKVVRTMIAPTEEQADTVVDDQTRTSEPSVPMEIAIEPLPESSSQPSAVLGESDSPLRR